MVQRRKVPYSFGHACQTAMAACRILLGTLPAPLHQLIRELLATEFLIVTTKPMSAAELVAQATQVHADVVLTAAANVTEQAELSRRLPAVLVVIDVRGTKASRYAGGHLEVTLTDLSPDGLRSLVRG